MAVRIGFIGCGGISRYHMGHLAKIKDAEMVAFCDVQKDRAQATAQEFGVTDAKVFTDYKRMYKEACFDAVYVGLPPFAHEEQELIAARQGIHLFVEKPVALSMELANKVSRAVTKAGIISSAGFQDRYQDIITRLKKEVANNPPAVFQAYWMGGMPGVMWWRRKEESGGQACEQTIHHFDMVRYLFGEVKSVHAVSSKGLMKDVPKYNIEDASAVNLQFKSGLCGTVFSACCLAIGKNGIDIWSKESVFEYTERTSLRIKRADREEHFYPTVDDYGQKIDDAFIAAIKKNDQSLLLSSYPDAAKSLAIVLAANESMATGEAVKL
jgi:myo-inositol 2-dehydrogenase/D-chiro-inositol 1-dehydrogenase